MNDQQKRSLVEHPRPLTFEGIPCKVAGWTNDYATVTAAFPGFYQASWETVERVINGEGNFTVEDVTLTNMIWKGDGTPIPDKVREYFNLSTP